MSLDAHGRPWGKGGTETVYEVSWAKLHDGTGMRMRNAEELLLRELRLVHDDVIEFKGKKPLGECPKVLCLIYNNNQQSIETATKLGYTTGTTFSTPAKKTCKEATTYWKVLPLATVAKAKKTRAPLKPGSQKKEKKKAKR